MENNSENNVPEQGVSVEQVQAFFDTQEGKSYLDSLNDKHFSKALETWKTNNIPKLKQEWEQEHNPKTPEQIKMAELENKIAQMEHESKHANIKSKAIKYLSENNLNQLNGIVDYLISDDEEHTTQAITKVQDAFNKAVQAAVEAKIKTNSYTPPAQGKSVQHGNSLQDAVRSKLFG